MAAPPTTTTAPIASPAISPVRRGPDGSACGSIPYAPGRSPWESGRAPYAPGRPSYGNRAPASYGVPSRPSSVRCPPSGGTKPPSPPLTRSPSRKPFADQWSVKISQETMALCRK
ncbi:hypothetical protein GCM10023191_059580 [Actinoallomurus oryzae]|uniref:Uncharacterized protein n=1 Tax=Actinoallomurus oryzae TaxID=502180 RepID=A0ABP8QNS3_9ACTN